MTVLAYFTQKLKLLSKLHFDTANDHSISGGIYTLKLYPTL